MKLRFYNAKILNKKLEIINGELWTDGGKISFIGKCEDFANCKNTELAEKQFDREINCGGNLLMPGFKNAHAHSAMTFLRSFADDLPLQEWLFEKVFPLEEKLTADDIYKLTKLALLEYISGGITSAFDMYFEPDAVTQACIEYGFRMVLCGSVGGSADSVNRLSDYYQKFNNLNPLISYRLGFHAEYTASHELMKEISALAAECKAPVYTHGSETEAEVMGCIERYKITPTELFESIGLFNHGGGIFHSVHVNDKDIEIMKNRGVIAVSNPASNLKLASGIAPLAKMKKAGVRIALGTDGPASNNSLNMWKEMYLASALQKYIEKDAAAFPAEDVLFSAVSEGADVMGLSNCDCLETGKNADLILVDLNKPNMRPLNNIVKNLVYAGSSSNVMITVIDGKILYENGEFFIKDSIESVYADADSIIKRISNREE